MILKNAETALFYGVPTFDRDHMGMTETEIRKIKRIYDWAIAPSEENIDMSRRNFISFVEEHDRRRGTDFHKTFSMLSESIKNIW
jgi:hypothetical protein